MENKKNMLIVDDIEVNRQILSELFQDEYNIFQAVDGLEALKIVEQYSNEITIILLDLVMPNMDGISVLKWLKENDYTNIPVIAVTAEKKYQLEALQNGAWDFIAKPTDNEVIIARVKNVVSRYALTYEMKLNQSLVGKNREQSNIMNSIPGGIATYKIIDNRFETLYFSDSVPELSGHTREEYKNIIGNDATQLIYSEDKKRIWNSAMEMLQSGQPIDETYRICHKNGTFIWIRINGAIVGEQEGVPILHAVFQKPSRMTKLYDNLVNESKDIIYVCDTENYDLLYINKSGLIATKKEKEDYSHRKCYEFLFGLSSPCPFCRMEQMNNHSFLEREFTYPVNNHIYSLRGKLTDWNGLHAHVEYVSDVTKERADQKKLVEARQRMEQLSLQAQGTLESYQSLVNAVPGGIAQYEVKGSEIFTRYFSDGLCILTGRSKDERAQMSNESVMSITYEPDLPLLKECIKQAVEVNKNIDITYRIKTKSGNPKWVHLSAAYLPGANGEKYYQAVFTDVDQLKKVEQELQENQLRYAVAVESSGINIWEYDIQKDSLYIVSNSSRIKQNCYYIDNYIEVTIKNGYVRKDCIERFLSIYERMKNGEKEITEDIWYKTTDQAGWWCERVTYTTAFDDGGKPVKAYGAGRDVTREKEAERKFYDEVSRYKTVQSETVSSLVINLTENRVLDVNSSFETARCFLGKSADSYFNETSKKITVKDLQKTFRSIFNREALLSSFSSGDFIVPLEITRTFDTNTVFWIRYNAHLIQNPNTRDVMAHISCVDVTNDKVMQIIMDTVAKTDYDLFVLINGVDDSARDYSVADGQTLFDEHQSFEEQNEIWIRKSVCPEDVKKVIYECKPENAWAKIKGGGTYKFSFSLKEKGGVIRRKQIQFTYIASPRQTYLMSRIDVNDIYEAQEKSKQKLEKALAAKSEFLSNMSHDMRTPMNGILGLLHLTLDMPGIPAEVYDNLRGMQDSSEYLLGLINDTLDMSKIESNRLTLEYETVNTAEFVKDVMTYVGPLAKEEGVMLNVATKNAELEYIKTPPLRLRQVFVNIVTNAIKFTPQGGKVDMVIECYKRENGIAYDRISVKDNGIGMSQEFLPKLFEPFEQENPQLGGKNQGTGLGMPIVKKLVEMMGGKIEVFSEKNVGTEVVVWLDFQRVYPDKAEPKHLSVQRLGTLAGKRILLAEDHPLNITIATQLLEKKKIVVEVAENGKKALELFHKSEMNWYDAVLMDIRMPIMDGLEASKAIRASNREDAKKIPIIAMTANAFDDDVKLSLQAGMNAHMAKPIEPEKLYDTLSEFLCVKCE